MNTKNSHFNLEIAYGGLFFLLLLATLGLYWSGLYSTFMLDDSPNLDNLEKITDETLWSNMGQYIAGGGVSSARPLSLLTFALQFYDWPHGPWAFKYVNLMIHLLNGCLVFWLSLLLARLLVLSTERGLILALLTTALWLLHPLQVSTVLYVVQRMTQLSTLFILVGLVAYLKGRHLLAENKLFKGFLTISLGIGLGSIFAVSSKENGVLLLLYVLALEMTLLQVLPKPVRWKIWFTTFIYVPITALILYFVVTFDKILQVYIIRDFTLGERLLTESRVLTEYLAKMLLLHPYDFGLFHDDFVISRGLLDPPTTVFATILVVVALIIAIRVRRLYPILAFGILWFFAGHVLESSFIGLVPYFEHRNYLPLVGVLFAVVYGGMYLFTRMKDLRLRYAGIFLSLFWLIAFPLISRLQVTLWQSPWEQAIYWAQEKPFSRYAQSQAFAMFGQLNKPIEANRYLENMLTAFPTDTGPVIAKLSLACLYKDTVTFDLQNFLPRLQTGKLDTMTNSTLSFILDKRVERACNVDSATLNAVFTALLENPNGAVYLKYLHDLYARFQAYEGHFDLAVQQIDKALALVDAIQWRMQKMIWLINANRLPEAIAYIQETRNGLNPLQVSLYGKELAVLQAYAKNRQESIPNP